MDDPALKRSGNCVFLLGAGFSADYGHPVLGNGVPVIKLHGSANWFRAKGKESDRSGYAALVTLREGEDAYRGYGSVRFNLDEFRRGVVHALGIDSDNAGSVMPVIVPPALGKSAHDEPIPTQWREAIHALARARHLWIIGYSFPDTDVFMPRLLRQGLGDNQDLEKVVIVNIDREEDWGRRLEMLFPPTFRQDYVCYVQSRTKHFLQFVRDQDDYKAVTDVLFRGGRIDGSGEFHERSI